MRDAGSSHPGIALAPNGLFGLAIMSMFAVVILLSLAFMLEAAKFNTKYVQERMPLGKEY